MEWVLPTFQNYRWVRSFNNSIVHIGVGRLRILGGGGGGGGGVGGGAGGQV